MLRPLLGLLLLLAASTRSSASFVHRIHLVYSDDLPKQAGKAILGLSKQFDVTSSAISAGICAGENDLRKGGGAYVLLMKENGKCQFAADNKRVFEVDATAKLRTSKDDDYVVAGWPTIALYIHEHGNTIGSASEATTSQAKEQEVRPGWLLVPVWMIVMIVGLLVLFLLWAIAPFVYRYIMKLKNKKNDKHMKKPEAPLKKSSASASETSVKSAAKEKEKKEEPKAERPKKGAQFDGQLRKFEKQNEEESKKEEKSERRETLTKPTIAKEKKSPGSHVAVIKRSAESVRLEPVTTAEFAACSELLGKLCVEYHDNSEKYNVTPNAVPGFLYKRMPKKCPTKPEDFSQIVQDLSTTVMEAMAHWHHPRFHAYFPAGRSYPDTLADVISSALGADGFRWEASPVITEMENAMMNWLARAFGLPECFLFQGNPADSPGGGVMQETASDAVANVVVASRRWKINQLMNKSLATAVEKDVIDTDIKARHELAGKLVYYTSKDAHSCMEKACKVAMVKCRSIQAKEINDWGITGTQLEKEIQKDKARGLIPTHIHVTLGTTSSAASDHLDTIWPIAKKHDMWIHVDAAYSGNCWIEPKYRTNCAGLEHVNSLNINAHKFLLHSLPCSMIWLRDIKLYQQAFEVISGYNTGSGDNVINMCNFGTQTSHKFKSIKTWMLFRMYGLEGVRHFVNHLIDMGAYFESLVRSHPNCRIFGHRNFGLFCFQYYEPGMTEKDISSTTTKLCQFLNATHKIFFTHTKVASYNLVRVMVAPEKSTRTSVDVSWAILRDLIGQFKAARAAEGGLDHLVAGSPLPGHRKAVLPGDIDHDLAGTENQNTGSMRGSLRSARSPMGEMFESAKKSGTPIN